MRIGKKSIISIIATTILSSNVFGVEAKLSDLTDMQNFYYQKGYNDASEKFYKMGYEQATIDLIKQLGNYKKLIDSYESGKYFSENGKITYPQMYRTRDVRGNYIIHIETPKIKEKLTIEEIFELPEIKCEGLGYDANSNSNNGLKINSLHNPNGQYNGVNSPIASLREFGVNFPRTARVKKLLDNSNIKYSETNNSYKAFFKNENDYKTFCKVSTGDEKCISLFKLGN